MKRKEKARPFIPTEIHVNTVEDEMGALAILSIQTTEGLLDIALDRQAADAIRGGDPCNSVKVVSRQPIRSRPQPGHGILGTTE